MTESKSWLVASIAGSTTQRRRIRLFPEGDSPWDLINGFFEWFGSLGVFSWRGVKGRGNTAVRMARADSAA